jgi:radical SAM protein with 4Fe4S-binding SPASM domain
MFGKWIHHKLKTNYQTNYTPLLLSEDELHPGCTIHRSLIVRMGDLAIVPCHRTSYDEFIGGHYIVENDKITGIKANNIQIMNQVWLNNMAGSPKCSSCVFSPYCMKGCFGS